MMYSTLADAFKPNRSNFNEKYRIWYYRPEQSRDACMGHEFCTEHGLFQIDTKNMEATHVLLGEVDGFINLEQVFIAFQGENWSPEGQARDLIRDKGLHHTSMSIGDVIEVDGKFWRIDRNPYFIELK